MEFIDEIVGNCAHLLASSARSSAISHDIVEIRQQQGSENCYQPKGRTDRKDSGSRVRCRGLKVLFQNLRLLGLIAGSASLEARQRIDPVDVVFTLPLQLALRHSPILNRAVCCWR